MQADNWHRSHSRAEQCLMLVFRAPMPYLYGATRALTRGSAMRAREGRLMATTTSAPTRETPVVGWQIEQAEYDRRVEQVRRVLQERKLDGLVCFHSMRIAYLTGFFHAQ